MLPNMLVIGSMKGGTTSLHHYLAQHPQIFMSARKELHYFSSNYDKGLEWYESQFEGGGGRPIRGETSPSYSKLHLHPDVPSRIYDALGKTVKFIYLVRNPIDRAISQLKHRHAVGLSNYGWKEELFINDFSNQFILNGKYGMQLLHYLEYFDIDQFLVVETANLESDRASVINRICDFLDIRTDQISSKDLDVSLHMSKNKLEFNAPAYALSNLITMGRPARFSDNWFLRRLLLREMPPVQLDGATHQSLKEVFREDILILEKAVGHSLRSLSADSRYLCL